MNPKEIKEHDHVIFFLGNCAADFREQIKSNLGDKNYPYIVSHKIANEIANSFDYAWLGDEKGRWIKNVGGVWHKNVKGALDKLIRYYCNTADLKTHVCKPWIYEMIREERQYLPDEFDTETGFINFKNGILDLETGELRAHAADLLTFVQIPWNYNPDATCPRFEKWLSGRLGGNLAEIDLNLKWLGYILQPGIHYQKILILRGPTKTGKSTFINIIAAIIGIENIASVSIQRITQKFGTWGVVSKQLNFFSDLPTNVPIYNASWVKLLIDKYIPYEIKSGEVGLLVKNITKHVFSTNQLPPVKHDEEAFYNRFNISSWKNTIPKKDRIKDFENTFILDTDEMEGIITMAVKSLVELERENGAAFNMQDEAEIRRIWNLDSNAVFRFLEMRCDRDLPISESAQVADLYTEFEKFIETVDIATDIDSQAKFTNELKRFGVLVHHRVIKRAGKRTSERVYKGINIKPEEIIVEQVEWADEKVDSILEVACREEVEDEDKKGMDAAIDSAFDRIRSGNF